VYIVTEDKNVFHAVSRMKHMQQHMRANFLHGLVQVHSTMFEITITCLENTFLCCIVHIKHDFCGFDVF